MENLYIVIPAYNEEENIKSVIDDWYPIIEKISKEGSKNSRLLIIDDGSKDNTYKILKEYAKTHPYFLPMTKKNSGHGATILYGYNYALEQNTDYIFQTDSDGQTLPEEFQQFWNLRKDYDMVIGWRNKRQDGLSRIFVTKVLKFTIKICFGENVKDANTPFRLMKADTLAKYIKMVPKDYNLSNVLLSVIYARKKCNVKFIPITFRPRQGGINSINLKKIFKIGKKAYIDFKELNRILK